MSPSVRDHKHVCELGPKESMEHIWIDCWRRTHHTQSDPDMGSSKKVRRDGQVGHKLEKISR